MYSVEEQYFDGLLSILGSGHDRPNERTGFGCTSFFGITLHHLFTEQDFPQLTHRYISEHVHKHEFNWFIDGHTNVKYLNDNNVKIWDKWADEDGELGPVYGAQMRNFNGQNIDQLKQVIESVKNNPDSRRHIITLWNPSQLREMKLPPCHLYYQFFVQGKHLNLYVLQRSADWIIGVPYDLALFSRILFYVCSLTGKSPGQLSCTFVDAHVYKNHFEVADEIISNRDKIQPLPKFELNGPRDIKLNNYKYYKKYKIEVNA